MSIGCELISARIQLLEKNADYPQLPEKDVLIDVTGTWKVEEYNGQDNVDVFYATKYEPFFEIYRILQFIEKYYEKHNTTDFVKSISDMLLLHKEL
ncbi:hypothetical protein [Sphingobacterium tabacisoli]|uniref:hypothetical protein n=1 Tax=Sphingobacterium tabacisoli TaxID=2044855 RepID=UPI001AEE6E37|nr:hypothetical protein [Sphingobacterium tabacisoli]